MEMPCAEVFFFIFICRIYSRNLTSTEIISVEIGQLSRSSWAKLMEDNIVHVLLPNPKMIKSCLFAAPSIRVINRSPALFISDFVSYWT